MAAPNAVIIEDRRAGARTTKAETEIVDLGRNDVDELYSSIVGAAMHAGVCVLTGTQLAPMFDTDTFRRLVSDLKHNGIVVIVDLCGEPLRAALEGGIDVLKLSHEEFIADGWTSSSGVDAIASGIVIVDDQRAFLESICIVTDVLAGRGMAIVDRLTDRREVHLTDDYLAITCAVRLS